MARRQVVGGLDIGTTKVVAVIAEVSPGGYPVLIGLGECSTIGLRKGNIVDSAALSKSIVQAVNLAKEMAGEEVKDFFLCSPLIDQRAEDLDKSLKESIELAGLHIVEGLPAVIASAEAILSDTDKQIGTILIDFGGATTGVAVFDQGFPVHTFSLAVGSEHISSDLAVCLHTSISEGERIKHTIGLVGADTGIDLEIPSVGGHEVKKVPASAAREIIQSRVQEIFELVQQELVQHFRLETLTGGLILGGGGSLLKGLLDLIAMQMQISKVVIGLPRKLSVPKEEWISPEYVSVFGLVIYGAKRSSRRSIRSMGWRKILDKFM